MNARGQGRVAHEEVTRVCLARGWIVQMETGIEEGKWEDTRTEPGR